MKKQFGEQILGTTKSAVMVGRYTPLHRGHMAVIDTMLERYGENSLLLVGSCNTPISLRHIFTFEDRLEFIQVCYPKLTVMGIPDFPGMNGAWLKYLDMLLAFGKVKEGDVLFFGGSTEDISFFIDAGRNVEIMNRFDGTTPFVSASQVRDALMKERSVDGLIDDRIRDLVVERYAQRLEQLSKR